LRNGGAAIGHEENFHKMPRLYSLPVNVRRSILAT
jgi:hypothetical protein